MIWSAKQFSGFPRPPEGGEGRVGGRLATSGLALVAVALFASVPARAAGEAELSALKQKKLESPYLKKAPWLTDYDAARAESARTQKPIFAYFTVSSFT